MDNSAAKMAHNQKPLTRHQREMERGLRKMLARVAAAEKRRQDEKEKSFMTVGFENAPTHVLAGV